MTNKNPKKNYSLKGKPLSTKIAFVVICILIFSLILGSFGGLIYLGKSCSSAITTVSAAGVGADEETTLSGEVTLNVAGIEYAATNVRTKDNQLCDFDQFLFHLPLTIRSFSFGNGVQTLALESSYYGSGYNIETDLTNLLAYYPGDTFTFNYGCFAYKLGAPANVGLVIEHIEAQYNSNIGRFGEFSSCEFYFTYGFNSSAVLHLRIIDTFGGYAYYQIYPNNRGETFSLNDLTHYSARYVYKLLPFNENAIQASYDAGFEDGVDYSREMNQVAVSEAFENGVNAGREEGFLEGVASASNYTFSGLLDAVFYAPVKMFVSLFNFDFLGVNVLGFVTTIITVIIAFGILKFFL